MCIINRKVNIAFALAIVCLPIIFSLVHITGLDFNLGYMLVVWAIAYCICGSISTLYYIKRGKKMNKFKFNAVNVILLIMILWGLISTIINKSCNVYLIIYIAYILIAICFIGVGKNKRLFNAFMWIIAICCVLSFLDPYGKLNWTTPNSYPLSMQFSNPNYSAYIVAMLIILVIGDFHKATSRKQRLSNSVLYLIYAIYLFINGSFTSISAVFLISGFCCVFLSIKYKKLQYQILLAILGLVIICLLTDLIPNISNIRTCQYNYFIEVLAVFDNIFNTSLLQLLGIEKVNGANGGLRGLFIKHSWQLITSSPRTIIFGYGAGEFALIKPHNSLLSLALDFGIIMPIIYVMLMIAIFIRVFKQKFNITTFYYAMACMCLLICSMLGSFKHQFYYTFMIVIAQLLNNRESQSNME